MSSGGCCGTDTPNIYVEQYAVEQKGPCRGSTSCYRKDTSRGSTLSSTGDRLRVGQTVPRANLAVGRRLSCVVYRKAEILTSLQSFLLFFELFRFVTVFVSKMTKQFRLVLIEPSFSTLTSVIWWSKPLKSLYVFYEENKSFYCTFESGS
jgi:hypothetical protein